MAVSTLDATVGGASSNTYQSQTTADQYFADRLDATAWTGASSDSKDQALLMATRRLEQESWEGGKSDTDQALAWPRYGTVDRDGFYQDSDAIPTEIVRAQAELALALLANTDFLSNTGLENYKRVKVGPVEVETRTFIVGGELPDEVYRHIAHLLKGTSKFSMRLVRA